MSIVAENEKREITSFLDLPPELRMMMIDKMNYKDRCRFSRCSRMCNKQAKTSKNYVKAIEFHFKSINNIGIYVTFNDDDGNIGYLLVFRRSNKRKRISYYANQEVELWHTKLKNSANLVELAIQHFRRLLNLHRNSIRGLYIEGQFGKDFDISMDKMRRLEELWIVGKFPQLITKLRWPLKELTADVGKNNKEVASWQQIYQVKNYLKIDQLKLNKQQFLRLRASTIMISIGYLTEQDIFNIIKSWQNGTIGKKVVYFSWELTGSIFDKRELHRLFGDDNWDDEDIKFMKIENQVEAGEFGVLHFSGNHISFGTKEEMKLMMQIYSIFLRLSR